MGILFSGADFGIRKIEAREDRRTVSDLFLVRYSRSGDAEWVRHIRAGSGAWMFDITRAERDEIRILLGASGRASFDGQLIGEMDQFSSIDLHLDAHGRLLRAIVLGPGRARLGNIVTTGDDTTLVTTRLKSPPPSPFELLLAPMSWKPNPNVDDDDGSQCVLIRAMGDRLK